MWRDGPWTNRVTCTQIDWIWKQPGPPRTARSSAKCFLPNRKLCCQKTALPLMLCSTRNFTTSGLWQSYLLGWFRGMFTGSWSFLLLIKRNVFPCFSCIFPWNQCWDPGETRHFFGVELSHGDLPARQPMAFSCAVGICRKFHGVDHGFRHVIGNLLVAPWLLIAMESGYRSLMLFSSIVAASTSDHHVSLWQY